MRFGGKTAYVIVVLIAAATGGCTYVGPVDNPVAQSLTWFSYVGGEDIRSACGPGVRDRFRFVYNGLYNEQVRTYDLVADARDLGATLESRVKRNLIVSGGGISLGDPFKSFNWQRVERRLSGNELAHLRQTAVSDGLTATGPLGLRLPSDEFYWLAMACLDGRFYLNAWRYPSDRFSALGFPKQLLELDETGVAFYEPRPDEKRPDRAYPSGGNDPFDRVTHRGFELQLGANRLIGGSGLF